MLTPLLGTFRASVCHMDEQRANEKKAQRADMGRAGGRYHDLGN